MSITKDEIDRYFGKMVKITFDDGSQKKGILRGKFGIDNSPEYDTISISSDEQETGTEFPVKIIQRIRLDL